MSARSGPARSMRLWSMQAGGGTEGPRAWQRPGWGSCALWPMHSGAIGVQAAKRRAPSPSTEGDPLPNDRSVAVDFCGRWPWPGLQPHKRGLTEPGFSIRGSYRGRKVELRWDDGELVEAPDDLREDVVDTVATRRWLQGDLSPVEREDACIAPLPRRFCWPCWTPSR